MFRVGDGNHRLFSWMEVAKNYLQEQKFHPRVKAKFLSGSESNMLQIIAALQAFNSVTASHVEHSWIVEADHTKRILSRPLETYKLLIDENNYKLLLGARQKTKNKAWYSENMTLEGAKYILASAHIRAGVERLQTKFATSETPYSEDEQKAKLKSIVETHVGEWKIKVPKMATVTNPELEGFFEKCVELYNWCEKTRKEGHLKDNPVKKGVQCGVDKCRVYASGSVSNALRCNLLEANVKPEFRDVYHHPSKLAEIDIKSWIARHGVWESILELAACALDGILDEILPTVPDSRLPTRLPNMEETNISLREEIQYDLQMYKDSVSAKFFPLIWKTSKPDIVTLRRRAKRLVYRFFLDMERKDQNYFWVYPLYFESWTRVHSVHSIYPAEGSEFPCEMTTWEVQNCPWYLDLDRWATPFNSLEVANLRAIEKVGQPQALIAEAKMQIGEGDPDESAKKVESNMMTFVLGKDKGRKSKKPEMLSPKKPKKATSTSLKVTSKFLFLYADIASKIASNIWD
ncbi:unnamed protein product [Calypogeia fissa]